MDPFVLAASGALLAALLLTSSPVPGAPDPIRAALDPPALASPHLEIDPPSWWMPGGNATTFEATWDDPTPGCALTTEWFRWVVLGPSPEGTLDSTTGANATFTAISVASGKTTLQVRSAVVLSCGSAAWASVATAEANVTVVAPVAVQNLSVDPDPVDAGGTAFLRGNVSGGAPPYRLRISWGNGNVTSALDLNPGAFAVPHTFPSGQYLPSVVVTDSAGLLAHASVGEPLTSSTSLAVGITAENTETDVGFPVRFNASVLEEPVGSSTGWSCSSSPTSAPAGAVSLTDFSCPFSHTGTGEVFFEVLPPAPQPAATTTLLESVVPLPTLAPLSANTTGEVGQSCATVFDVTGGVPPLHLDWFEVGTSVAGSLTLNADGRVVLALTPARAGSLVLVARLVDDDGASTSNATTNFVVDPALNDSLATGRGVTTGGAELALTGSVNDGVPPFVWVVTPGSVPSNETAPAGSLGSVGSFEWQGSYDVEGWTTLTLTVVDAAGGFTIAQFDLEMVAPLTGNLSVDPGGPHAPGTFDLALVLTGGLPPFAIDINASDGMNWNRTIPSDGSSAWSFAAEPGGGLQVRVVATDALGDEREWNATVTVVPAPRANTSSPPPGRAAAQSPSLVLAAGLLALGLLAIGLYLLRRRRTRSTPMRPPDPVEVLRGIIEPSDGADRATVELLAEEAGVAMELAHSTIDRLIVEGTVRSEIDVDGQEVLAWATPPAL